MKRLILFCTTLLLVQSVHASQDGVLSLSPAVVMLRGEEGQSTTQTLTLRNGTSREFSFDLIANDVVISVGRRQYTAAGLISGSIAATAVFSRNSITIPAHSAGSVTITLTLPPKSSQRAVQILFRGTTRVMSGNVPMTASLGSLMTFTLSDDISLHADGLAVRPQSASANLTVHQRCSNDGSEPFVARGMMAVLDQNGTLVGKSILRPQRLLPKEASIIEGEYGGELQPGHYRVVVSYDYEGHSLTRAAEVEIQ